MNNQAYDLKKYNGAQAEKKSRFVRNDIQALRAIAVLLVIFDHLILVQRLPGHPLGGFIGVDIFFVISGFLITQHLVEEAARTGRISFLDFYRRRIRRILPMAFLVIGVTLIASLLVFWPWQTAASARDGMWAALFVSNIAFAIRGVDYFASEHVSVFQHYWSLSVEEQFYLVWPILVAIIAGAIKNHHSARRWLFGAAAALGIFSLVWACHQSISSNTTAYFSTFCRGFQFAIGGMLAIGGAALEKLPDKIRVWVSALGIIFIICSIWIIDPAHGFPGPMGLLPAIGAGLVIAAGTGTAKQVALWPLGSAPVLYLGDISYSLYLWHWPVIVFLKTLVPRDIAVIPGTLIITLVLSAISYRCVERSIIKSRWFAPSGMQYRGGAIDSKSPGRAFALNALGVLGSIIFVGLVIAAGDVGVRQVAAARVSGVSAEKLPIQDQPQRALEQVLYIQGRIASSANRKNWANLKPDISNISTYGTEITRDCWTTQHESPRSCVRGNPAATHTVVVLGDSIAMNAAFSVEAFVRNNPDWKLVVYAKLGCAFAQVSQPAPDGSAYPECDEFRRWAVGKIRELSPDAVWLTSAVPTRVPGMKEKELFAYWKAGAEATLSQLGSVHSVFIVAPPPAGQDLIFCSRPYNSPRDCSSNISSAWFGISNANRSAAERFGRTYIDSALWYCDRSGHCPAVIGDYVVRRDERHLTYDYGISLEPLIEAWILVGK